MSLIYLFLILLKATEHVGTRMDSERYVATPTMSEIAKNLPNSTSLPEPPCMASTNQYIPPTITITVPKIVPTFCIVTAFRSMENSTTMMVALPIIVSNGAVKPADVIRITVMATKQITKARVAIRIPWIILSEFKI